MDYDKKDLSVIGDYVYYSRGYSKDLYWKIKQDKKITIEDDWFDYVIHRTDDEEQFNKDIEEVALKIKNLMES